MIRKFFSLNISERENEYSLWISRSDFEGQEIRDNRSILRTTFSKESLPYPIDSVDWMLSALSLAQRELRYEAQQHLTPNATGPIGDGMQHEPMPDDDELDGD